jgi:hypothetical protein
MYTAQQTSKAAKTALQKKGLKNLMCHQGTYITAAGWQLNNRIWGTPDRYGNGRYVVAEYCTHSGKWVDVHGFPI